MRTRVLVDQALDLRLPPATTWNVAVTLSAGEVKWQGEKSFSKDNPLDLELLTNPFGLVEVTDGFDWDSEICEKLVDLEGQIDICTPDSITRVILERCWIQNRIHRVTRSSDFICELYWTQSCPPKVLVVTLGGSSGGFYFSRPAAGLLANMDGVAGMAISYFGSGQIFEDLDRIPLESFYEAWRWAWGEIGEILPVILIGRSRGAECALLLASYYSEVKGAFCFAPTQMTWGVFGTSRSSWTYAGRDLTSTRLDEDLFRTAVGGSKSAIKLAPWFKECAVRAPISAAIPIQNASCPITLFSGAEDSLWPSAEASKILEQRNKRVRGNIFPGAGHSFDIAGQPVTKHNFILEQGGSQFALGGEPLPTILAELRAWKLVRDNVAEILRAL